MYTNFRLKEKKYHQKAFSIGNGFYKRGHHKTAITRQGKFLNFDLVVSNKNSGQTGSLFIRTFV